MTQIIATLIPSAPRRIMATAALAGVGLLLLWVGLVRPPASVGWQIYLLLLAAGALWVALRLWQATARHVLLTEAGIFDSDGQCLAPIDAIEAVERGVFAFKPSNGFTVLLKQPAPRGWAPGLWWRMGRRLGIGGVTPAAQGKYMAEMLAMAVKTPEN